MAKAKSRAQKASIDLHYMGPEPDPNFVVETGYDARLTAALRWYGYFYKLEDAKKWLLEYVKKNYPRETYEAIKAAPTWRTSMTAGVLAHLLSRGTKLLPSNLQFLDERINLNATKRDEEELTEEGLPIEKPEPVIRLNPHIRLQRKIAGQLAEIEGLVDEALAESTDFSFYTYATAEQASPQLISKAKDFYQRILHDMEEHPQDYKGAYHKRELALYKSIVADADRLTHVKRVVRQVRKPAKQSTEKVVKGLKFKEKDHDLKVVSIAPTDVVGSKELWVYSTKYNEIGVFRAKTDMGLQVKGTSIIDFDEKSSVVKKVRKPEELLPQITGGKRSGDQAFASLTTTPKPISARVREDQLLLKVVK